MKRLSIQLSICALFLYLSIFSTAAYAHVQIDQKAGREGEDATLVFRVPNERANISTVKIEIQIPQDAAFSKVEPAHKDGWEISTTKTLFDKPVINSRGEEIDETVSIVSYTGGEITGSDSEEFTLVVGPLPHSEKVYFKTLQTYSDGEIVRWIEEEGVEASDHSDRPSPAFTIETKALSQTNISNKSSSEFKPLEETENDGKKSNNSDVTLFIGLGTMVLVVAGLIVYIRFRKH